MYLKNIPTTRFKRDKATRDELAILSIEELIQKRIEILTKFKRLRIVLKVKKQRQKISLSTHEFLINIAKWWGVVFVNNSLVKILKTCKIDFFYFLYGLPGVQFDLEDNENDLSKNLFEIIQYIENRNLDEAKFKFSKDVIKMNLIKY